jgi:hypothetical protein
VKNVRDGLLIDGGQKEKCGHTAIKRESDPEREGSCAQKMRLLNTIVKQNKKGRTIIKLFSVLAGANQQPCNTASVDFTAVNS